MFEADALDAVHDDVNNLFRLIYRQKRFQRGLT